MPFEHCGPSRRALLAAQRRRAWWAGLRAWFVPVDGARPRVEQFHDVRAGPV
jgi:Protein of unknown function (DUF2397)